MERPGGVSLIKTILVFNDIAGFSFISLGKVCFGYMPYMMRTGLTRFMWERLKTTVAIELAACLNGIFIHAFSISISSLSNDSIWYRVKKSSLPALEKCVRS